MPPVAPTYKPGYLGTVEIDGNPIKVQGWKGKDAVETWDASATGDGGWGKDERALRRIEFTFSVACPASGIPGFKTGEIYPVSFTIDGAIDCEGNVLIKDKSPNVDLKGGVIFDCVAMSHGEMTGALLGV